MFFAFALHFAKTCVWLNFNLLFRFFERKSATGRQTEKEGDSVSSNTASVSFWLSLSLLLSPSATLSLPILSLSRSLHFTFLAFFSRNSIWNLTFHKILFSPNCSESFFNSSRIALLKVSSSGDFFPLSTKNWKKLATFFLFFRKSSDFCFFSLLALYGLTANDLVELLAELWLACLPLNGWS